MSEVAFVLNGKPCAEYHVAPTTTVLDWLRGVARLTGTKEGCPEGDCGACTIVLGRPVDGALRYEAVNSCLIMLPQLHGCAVLTVEGLARDGNLHPVQQALMETHATQCGFCTPGFAMAMFAFRQEHKSADDAEIHEMLAGNLCRCTGYRSIVDACRKLVADDAGTGVDDEAGRAHLRTLAPAATYEVGGQLFLAPSSLDELLAARTAHPDGLLLAGGTDLGLRVSKERAALPVVVSTMHVAELRQIITEANALVIGAAATYSAMLPHPNRHFPAFGALVRRIGSRQIRNLGTLAGNLATASPIGDTLPCLIALGATVMLISPADRRAMPVESFVTGYRTTALAPDEIIAAIRIPFMSGRTFAAYKVCKRFDQDISTLVAAFALRTEGGRVSELRAAYGGMAARPMRASHLEAALIGRTWNATSFDDVDGLIARDFRPTSDHRGGAAYRLRAAAGLVRRFQLETTTSFPLRLEEL